MDQNIKIATVKSVRDDADNTVMPWNEFKSRCENVTRTGETAAEYADLKNKDRRDGIKDVGGFIGGQVRYGSRKKEDLISRSLITLDLDDVKATPDAVWDDFTAKYPHTAALIYSTHSHTPENPRLRLVIPLLNEIPPDQYGPIARKVAEDIGTDMFDKTTFEVSRLFFWPSAPKDGEFFFRESDGEPLDPQSVTAVIPEETIAAARSDSKKCGDPRLKDGVIGAFCRTYTIEEGIDTFLQGIYKKGTQSSRYTYVNGTTANGLVILDSNYAYSHHSTDPAYGHSHNIFDLVRIGLYGDLDKGIAGNKDMTELPSFNKMVAMALNDKRVCVQMANRDFEGVRTNTIEIGDSWKAKLKYRKDGTMTPMIENARLILENDEEIAGRIGLNELSGHESVKGTLPWERETGQPEWTDRDEACLRAWMEKKYGLTGKDKIADAVTAVALEHKFHPIRDYLRSLEWDGTERLDRLVIDYVGADDTLLTRMMTRIHFTAAVKRVFEPGCQYDHALILTGPEGIGKSTLFHTMAGDWFNDSIFTTDGKEGMDQLRGSWIIEMAELSSMKRADVETMKAFLTRRSDRYRAPYARHQNDHPRQCVFCGTTNETYFLKGDTGNRRYWIISVDGDRKRKDLKDNWMEALEKDRDQIWAEAVRRYRDGERLELTGDLAKEALRRQEAVNDMADDPDRGMIDDYLDMPLPPDWGNKDARERYDYVHSPNERDDTDRRGDGRLREKVCAKEIMVECLGLKPSDKDGYRSRKINSYLEKLGNWKNVGLSSHCRKVYGPQRSFERVRNNDKTGIDECNRTGSTNSDVCTSAVTDIECNEIKNDCYSDSVSPEDALL